MAWKRFQVIALEKQLQDANNCPDPEATNDCQKKEIIQKLEEIKVSSSFFKID
jgi:hypothetical protein